MAVWVPGWTMFAVANGAWFLLLEKRTKGTAESSAD